MEDALALKVKNVNVVPQVLILVLMEDALARCQRSSSRELC